MKGYVALGRDLGLGDPNAGEGGYYYYYYSSVVEMLSIRAMSYVLCAGRRGVGKFGCFSFFLLFLITVREFVYFLRYN